MATTAVTKFQRGPLMFEGTTGMQILQCLIQRDFRMVRPQPLLVCESNEQAPAHLRGRVLYMPLVCALDSVATYLETADIPKYARDLPLQLFQSTRDGGGKQPGVIALACVYLYSMLRETLDTAGDRADEVHLDDDGLVDVGSATADLVTGGAGGSTANGRIIAHLNLRTEQADGRTIFINLVGPHAGESKTDYAVERANAIALLLSLQRRRKARSNVVHVFWYDGTPGTRSAVLESVAADIQMLAQSPAVEECRRDLRDPLGLIDGRARQVDDLREPARFLNVVRSVVLRVPVAEWQQRWHTQLPLVAVRESLDGADTVAESSEPDTTVCRSDAERLVNSVMAGGANTNLQQISLQRLGRAGDIACARDAWARECEGRVDAKPETLRGYFRVNALSHAAGLRYGARAAALRRAKQRLEGVRDELVSLEERCEADARQKEDAIQVRMASHGAGSPAVRSVQAQQLLLWVSGAVAHCLQSALTPVADELDGDVVVAETDVEILKALRIELSDSYRLADESYKQSLQRTEVSYCLPIDDERYGPLSDPDGSPRPLPQRMVLAAKSISGAVLALKVGEATQLGREVLTARLLEEAKKHVGNPPSLWEALGARREEVISQVSRLVQQVPRTLDASRLEAYGRPVCGRSIECDTSLHAALMQTDSLHGFQAYNNGDRYTLRLRTVRYGVPLACLAHIDEWMEAYTQLKEGDDGAPLHCPEPWVESEMLKEWEAIQAYDRRIYRPQVGRSGGSGHTRQEGDLSHAPHVDGNQDIGGVAPVEFHAVASGNGSRPGPALD